MRTKLYQLDAFSTRRFAGNPAAVMPMPAFPDEALMQALAAENNLAETAFLVRDGNDYQLRWCTPLVEVPLCGHATLASAAVVMERPEPGRTTVVFHTKSGPLTVTRVGKGDVMNFPARVSAAVAPPPELTRALGIAPVEVFADAFNSLALLEGEQAVRDLTPDFAAIARLNRTGVIVTAAGAEPFDFVSRSFAPAKGIAEDPVTGGAHCALTPYWPKRLDKTEFRAFQASRRGGEIICRLVGQRVELEGQCVFSLEGEVDL